MTLDRSSARALLGVDTSATRDEITRAYHRLALQVHPDRCAATDAGERFLDLRKAYEQALAAATQPAPQVPVTALSESPGPRRPAGGTYLRREAARQVPIVAAPAFVTPVGREAR